MAPVIYSDAAMIAISRHTSNRHGASRSPTLSTIHAPSFTPHVPGRKTNRFAVDGDGGSGGATAPPSMRCLLMKTYMAGTQTRRSSLRNPRPVLDRAKYRENPRSSLCARADKRTELQGYITCETKTVRSAIAHLNRRRCSAYYRFHRGGRQVRISGVIYVYHTPSNHVPAVRSVS
jgi:hypothetical protein